MRQRTKAYVAWIDMRQRCLNVRNADYQAYGGRGITICTEWGTFSNFLADMGEPAAGMWLDRRDNDGPYSKENCRWATPREQNQNRRNNRNITWRGETLCIREWSRRVGISDITLSSRLRRGWPIERALTEGVLCDA